MLSFPRLLEYDLLVEQKELIEMYGAESIADLLAMKPT